MFHINRTGRIGRSRKFNSLSLRSKIKANPNNVLLNRRRVRLGRIKASSYNSSLKPGSIRHAGKEASAHNLSLKRGSIFRGLFNMAKCKACTKVMQTVVKAMGKDLGKRGIVNALDKACMIIPIKKYRSKCHDSVKKHGGEIANMIANQVGKHVDAKKICKFLKLC